jgi:predicted dehydrogenase
VSEHRTTGSTAAEVRIGVIGYGAMGKAHSYGYAAAPVIRPRGVRPRLTIMSGRNEPAVREAASALGFATWTTDWRELVASPAVDVVDICTPPGTHAEIITAAALAGKAVICEKPLAVRLSDAHAAAVAVAERNVLAAIGFNYRYLPAVALMRQLIVEGEIGEVLLWRGSWLSDEFLDPAIPFDWRFDAALGGSTIADLGSHLVDLAEWMVGPVTEVCAQSATFTAERPVGPGDPAKRPVGIDDASSALLRFGSGATGVLEVARTCARRPCDFTVEVNGTKGTAVFSYARLNELRLGRVVDDERYYGMRTIRAEHPSHPYEAGWWAIGQGVGYDASFVNFLGGLLETWPAGPWLPDLKTGLRVQRVCAAMERSAVARAWVTVGDVVAS